MPRTSKKKPSLMEQDFEDFIGTVAFEDDKGWSWEVWQTAYKRALERVMEYFYVEQEPIKRR